VVAVNNAYGDRLAKNKYEPRPWVDALFFGDCRWYPWHKEALLRFGGLKVTTCEKLDGEPGIKVISKRGPRRGLSKHQGQIVWNKSSGACAINLATLLGAKRIVLLGFDMKTDEAGNANWHEDHPTRRPKEPPYPHFMRPFPTIANDAREMGVEILNATPGSALTLFPFVDLEEIACG
jgi:hypothetical protein